MAWRIADHVVRGEIDNRKKGTVQGLIWIEGRSDPIRLDLTGNACKDLAGTILRFKNPGETYPLSGSGKLFAVQKGSIGDLTASRKVRTFDIPFEEAYKMIKQGLTPPEHMSNSLYLEWYSIANGRVVIESADFELEISAPEWQLTNEEDQQRNQQAQAGFSGFMDKMNQALEQAEEKTDYEKEDWDEFDYEHFLLESDARTEKYMELLDKYGDREDSEEIIAREMGWRILESKEENLETPFEAGDPAWKETPGNMDIPDLQPEPATEGVDWIRTEDGDIRHPLQHKCHQGALALWREVKALKQNQKNEALDQLRFEYQTTAAKLAGALNDLAYGRDLFDPAFSTASLKRALGHLHTAQEALLEVQEQSLLPAEIILRVREEFFELREGILNLMDKFRGRSGTE